MKQLTINLPDKLTNDMNDSLDKSKVTIDELIGICVLTVISKGDKNAIVEYLKDKETNPLVTKLLELGLT